MQVNKSFQLYNQFSNLQLFLSKNGTFNVLFLGAKNQVFIANLRKPQNQLLWLEQKKKSTYIHTYHHIIHRAASLLLELTSSKAGRQCSALRKNCIKTCN